MAATMKAVRIHSYGAPEVLVLEEAPRPEPAAGEVLVRVHGAGVNAIDWKTRAGYLQQYVPFTLPAILGWDIAGTVAELGAGVTGLKVGDEVYGQLEFPRAGGYAQYVAVKADTLAPKPRTLNFAHAAGVPIAGLAAWHGLFSPDAIDLQPGQTVLIQAAAGGVGSFAVQLAKWKGARVIGTASGDNVAFAKSLGADEVIDYTKQKFEDAVGKVDAVLDNVGGEVQERSLKVLKPGGILATSAGLSVADAAEAQGIRSANVMGSAAIPDLKHLTTLIDEHVLKVMVD